MRLLLDQNLSRRLVDILAADFPDTVHVVNIGLDRAADIEIWNHARENGLTILSKDSDFHHLSFRHGAPPKAIWLNVGNCSTDRIAECVTRNALLIRRFLADGESSLLVLTDV